MDRSCKRIFCIDRKTILRIGMVFLIIVLVSCEANPSLAPTMQSAASTEGVNESSSEGRNSLDVPIGIGIYDSSDVEIFNQYADEQDIIAVRSKMINLLGEVKVGNKMLVLGPGDEPLDHIRTLISEAIPYGLTYLGYNLEKSLPDIELVSKEKDVASLADEQNLIYVFGPTLNKLTKNYIDFATNADVILLQAQRYQTSENFEEQVEDLLDNIKSSNPEVKVWVQVSVNPPENPDIEAQEVIQQIEAIADKSDLIWIFFAPQKASVMEEVLKSLQQFGAIQPNVQPTPAPTLIQTLPITSIELIGYLCGYWTFTRPSELPLSDLRTYTNVIFYNQDWEQDIPNEADLLALRENNIKLVIKLDKRIVEETFDQEELEKFKARLDQYQDVIYAIWPIDEPYKQNRWKKYSLEQLEELIENVKVIFPDYKIWVNFLTPTVVSAQQNGYPGIPDNIDIVSIDIYLHTKEVTEDKYKEFIGENLSLILENAGSKPVFFASRSFSSAEDQGTPLLPDQVDWDVDLVDQYGLLGLGWYFYDDSTPAEKAYGAIHYPEIVAKQMEAGEKLISQSRPEYQLVPTPTLEVSPSPENTTQPTVLSTPALMIHHPIVFAIEQETLSKYPDVQALIVSTITDINQRLLYAGILRELNVKNIEEVYNKSHKTSCKAREEGVGYLPEEYCNHLESEIFVVVDETDSKNYPDRQYTSVEWHGVKDNNSITKDNPHHLFSKDGTSVLAHELGHILGLPDLYLLRIAEEDNMVNQQGFPSEAYNPFDGDIMFDMPGGGFSSWDKEIIDRENTTLPARFNTWFDYQPADTVLLISDPNNQPLAEAQIKIYTHARTPEHEQVIDNTPEYQGQTDTTGRISLGANVLGTDRYDSVRVFLVEIQYHDQVDYQWFSFIDINYAFWNGEDILITSSLSSKS